QRLHRACELEGQVSYVFDGLRARDGAQNELLLSAIYEAAAGIRGVLLHDFSEFTEREVCVAQFRRIGVNDDLPLVTAARFDLRNTRHRPQLWLDDELLQFGQLQQLL